jgi:serine protease Do
MEIRKFRAAGIAVMFAIVGIIFGLVLSSRLGIETNGHTGVRAAAPVDGVDWSGEVPADAVAVLETYSSAMTRVVAAVMPSVVNISTTQHAARRAPAGGGFMNDPFFRRFFGEDFGRLFDQQQQPRDQSSLGSGVIVDASGIIITNNHVVKDADEITVTLNDKREFKGTVLGTDPKTDIAVIRIENGGNLPAIKWGDSDALRVGEVVIAVGSPYGLMQTVTSGIVSAKGRANVNIADYEDFIQTDAAINPGNSGGPLINIRGELVGINTAIFSTSGGYQGIGFSIPARMVRSVMDSLIEYKRVVRGWLGVNIQQITSELAAQFDITETKGALVSDVQEDSPAEHAGIKRGDIIVSYDGTAVTDPTSLRNMVATTKPGAKVSLDVIRQGDRVTLSVEIGELEGGGTPAEGGYDNALGSVKVQDITPELRQKLNISRRISGVIVTEAGPETGLRQADVILEINRKPVEDAATYGEMAAAILQGEDVLLLVYREGGIFFLTVPGR